MMTRIFVCTRFCTIGALCAALALSVPMQVHAADPPYEQKLVRLAEVLGSVHFLRSLCGELNGGWRDAMARILDSEKAEETRRAKLTAAFNHGYRAFDSTYARCTPQAIEALDRYMKEGEALADDIASRYGN